MKKQFYLIYISGKFNCVMATHDGAKRMAEDLSNHGYVVTTRTQALTLDELRALMGINAPVVDATWNQSVVVP